MTKEQSKCDETLTRFLDKYDMDFLRAMDDELSSLKYPPSSHVCANLLEALHLGRHLQWKAFRVLLKQCHREQRTIVSEDMSRFDAFRVDDENAVHFKDVATSLRSYVRLFGSEIESQINISPGEIACTDGTKNLFLPRSINEFQSRELGTVIYFHYLLHELLHVSRETACVISKYPDILEIYNHNGGSKANPTREDFLNVFENPALLGHLYNIIEDGVIDRHLGRASKFYREIAKALTIAYARAPRFSTKDTNMLLLELLYQYVSLERTLCKPMRKVRRTWSKICSVIDAIRRQEPVPENSMRASIEIYHIMTSSKRNMNNLFVDLESMNCNMESDSSKSDITNKGLRLRRQIGPRGQMMAIDINNINTIPAAKDTSQESNGRPLDPNHRIYPEVESFDGKHTLKEDAVSVFEQDFPFDSKRRMVFELSSVMTDVPFRCNTQTNKGFESTGVDIASSDKLHDYLLAVREGKAHDGRIFRAPRRSDTTRGTVSAIALVIDLSRSFFQSRTTFGKSPFELVMPLIAAIGNHCFAKGISTSVLGAYDLGRRPVHVYRIIDFHEPFDLGRLMACHCIAIGGFRTGSVTRYIDAMIQERFPEGNNKMILFTDAGSRYIDFRKGPFDEKIEKMLPICSSCLCSQPCHLEPVDYREIFANESRSDGEKFFLPLTYELNDLTHAINASRTHVQFVAVEESGQNVPFWDAAVGDENWKSVNTHADFKAVLKMAIGIGR